MRKTWSVPVFALLAGCAVGVPEYPPNWDPLLPPAFEHCEGFEGTYADRGETRDRLSARSLTRELFGDDREWKLARRVALALPQDDVLRVTVYGEQGMLFRRDLHESAGEFECRGGKLLIRDKRWVAEDVVAGHENVTLALHRSGSYLVAQAKERTYAVVFLVVPLAADATHWYRFSRLGPASD